MRLVSSWLPVLVWTAVILAASNDSFSAGQSRGWLEQILGRDVPAWVNVAIRKAAHLVEYGVLAALTLRAARRTWAGSRLAIAIALLLPLGVAITDEARQSFTVYRSGSAGDVVLDFAGAAVAVTAMTRALRRARQGSVRRVTGLR